MAINRYTGAANPGQWQNTGNWSLGSIPTAGDGNTATFDGASPAHNVSLGGTRAANALDLTGWSGTLTFDAGSTLTVSGAITLAATVTFVPGGGSLILNASATITSNGKVVNIPFRTNAGTTTLGDNWTCTALVTLGAGSTGTYTVNGNTLTCGGDFTASANTGTINGTTNIVLNGTGTVITPTSTSGSLRNNLTINTAGTITIASAFRYNTGTLTWTAGTVVATSGTLYCNLSVTINTSTGIVWGNINIDGGNSTMTLSSDLRTSGSFNDSASASSVVTINGAFNIYVGGDITNAHSSGRTTGTASFVMNGTGTLSTNGASTGGLTNNITINTAGTITIGSKINYSGGTLTWVAGTVDALTNTSTLTLINNDSTVTLNTAGIAWYNISVVSTMTITLNGTLRVTGTFTPPPSANLAIVSGGIDANTWLGSATAAVTRTLAAGFTNRVRTSFTASGSKNAPLTYQSSVVNGTKAIFTLDSAATLEVAYVNAIDIDSSSAQTVWTYQGTNTRSPNWMRLDSVAPSVAFAGAIG